MNSLFSGLALGGVVFAIVLQTIELRLQRKEIRDNRKELKRTADANTQLVKLNTLATLVQYYLNHPDRSQGNMDNAYMNTLVARPDMVETTLKYKIDVCASLLESMYGELTGKSIGKPIEHNFQEERKIEWHRCFVFLLQNGPTYWNSQFHDESVSGFRDRAKKMEFVNHWKGNKDQISRLLTWIDAIDAQEAEYRSPLEAMRLKAERLIQVISVEDREVSRADYIVGRQIYSEMDGLYEKSKILQR